MSERKIHFFGKRERETRRRKKKHIVKGNYYDQEREIYDIEENMDMLVTQLNQDVLNDMRVSLMVLNFFQMDISQ